MNGFLDPEQVWQESVATFHEYLEKEPSLEDEIDRLCSDIPIGKEEYALGSQYLHRGFYCPSPVPDKIVVNIHRGRIAKRMRKNSRPTNRYEFDLEGRLRLAETIYPNGSVSTEFLFYEGDVVFGLTYDGDSKLKALSVERYEDGRLVSYLLVDCYQWDSESGCDISRIAYERYGYAGDIMTVDAVHELSKFEGILSGLCGKGVLRATDDHGWELLDWKDQRFHPGPDAFFRAMAEKGRDTSMMEEFLRQFRKRLEKQEE